ncbi:hypothetical protein OROHE_026641 [Orobanche hederae]
MNSNERESLDSKAEFRKPSNDANNRKYRRRSPAGRSASSSSSDGSPHRKRSSSPGISRKDITKASDDKRKRDDTRNQTGRESYKQSDRHSSRSYYRHDDHNRRDRYVDDYDRGYSKSSYRSSRDSRYNINSDYSRSDKEHPSRDYVNDGVTQSRAKYDGLGYRSRDKDTYDRAGSDRRHANTEERDIDRDRVRDKQTDDRGDRYGRTDYRKSSGHSLKESSLRESKEVDVYDEKRRYEDRGSYKEQGHRERNDCSDDTSNKGQDSVGKKPKIFCMDSTGPGPDGTSEKDYATESAIDAAKIAALKAAELVTKNIAGTGCMSTDQKKKLLWANKKNTATEESPHRWDITNFGDRERQEKFNKLMGVKGETRVENKQDNPDVEKQREHLQMELEKQYTAGLRRRDGRTVGLGL